MKRVKISVRDLIYFVMRSGDIDNTFLSRTRALEGMAAHKKIQDNYPQDFKKEVKCSTEYPLNHILFEIVGRCDGLGIYDDKIILEEIKSTKRKIKDLKEDMNSLHWAQLLCYGFIFSEEYREKDIHLKLTYYSLSDEKAMSFNRVVEKEEIDIFFHDLLLKYLEFAKMIADYVDLREGSFQNLTFPFSRFRPGQRECALAVYQALGEEFNLLLQAPTGIGKSMATIFPSLLRVKEKSIHKLFYFVSRSTQKNIPLDALEILRDRGLIIKSLELTGKDKICINDTVSCNPKDCPYAKGHFDRVNDCLLDILEHENDLRQEKLKKYGLLHMVCPHELQFDMINFTDFIIGDYNYYYDPSVRLSYFDEPGEMYGILVDEAHGLISRARDMYSEKLNLMDLKEVDKYLRKKDTWAKKALNQFIELLLKKEKEYKNGPFAEKQPPKELEPYLREYLLSMEEFLTTAYDEPGYDKVLDIYFICTRLLKLLEYYNEGFRMMYGRLKPFSMEILCLDPSRVIGTQSTGKSHIYFSATLLPEVFHKKMLSYGKRSEFFSVDSPFPKEHQKTFWVPGLPMTYRQRENQKEIVLDYLMAMAGKKGNFLFFFPSYDYMEEIYEGFISLTSRKTIIQNKNMTEQDRIDYINHFKYTDSIVGFAVMGGVFSEGIDLPGSRLHGVAILTIGMPQVNDITREMMKLFDEEGESGFDYTYLYPGFTKVAQSGGRLIRTYEDKGILLLLDHRFGLREHRSLLPKNWVLKPLFRPENLEHIMSSYWKEFDL
ncbi:MAG: ATP-dependent DNA helicase [Tissierellia bacterium]|nr:ATP-dependent DNA helicase [Tissierellia bacterium]